MNKIEKVLIFIFLIAILVIAALGQVNNKKIGGSSLNDVTYFPGTVQVERANFGSANTIEAISTSSATYSISATEECNNSSYNITPLGAVLTVTLPATSTLFTTCLTSVGQFADNQINVIGTSTVIAAGAGGTLGYTSSSTIAAGKYGILRILRDTALTYKAYLINIPN